MERELSIPCSDSGASTYDVGSDVGLAEGSAMEDSCWFEVCILKRLKTWGGIQWRADSATIDMTRKCKPVVDVDRSVTAVA